MAQFFNKIQNAQDFCTYFPDEASDINDLFELTDKWTMSNSLPIAPLSNYDTLAPFVVDNAAKVFQEIAYWMQSADALRTFRLQITMNPVLESGRENPIQTRYFIFK